MSKDEKVTTQTLRNAVNLALEHKSLRTVAREIGISAAGLKKFAEGSSDIYGPTRRRMLPWYRLFRETLPQAPEPGAVAAAVDVLLSDMPAELQGDTRAELGAILVEAYAGFVRGTEAAAVPPRPARSARRTSGPAPAAATAPAQPSRVYLLVTMDHAAFPLLDLPPGATVLNLPGPMPRA